jgi:hypothetical protein
MVFAHGIEGDVFDKDHFVVFFPLDDLELLGRVFIDPSPRIS